MQFDVVDEFTREGAVVLYAISNDGEVRLAYVTQEAFKDGFGISGDWRLTASQRQRLALANIDALSRIATRMHDNGEAYQPEPGARPYVIITADDLSGSGEQLSATVLD